MASEPSSEPWTHQEPSLSFCSNTRNVGGRSHLGPQDKYTHCVHTWSQASHLTDSIDSLFYFIVNTLWPKKGEKYPFASLLHNQGIRRVIGWSGLSEHLSKELLDCLSTFSWVPLVLELVGGELGRETPFLWPCAWVWLFSFPVSLT